jgi:hypothetical protein
VAGQIQSIHLQEITSRNREGQIEFEAQNSVSSILQNADVLNMSSILQHADAEC